MKIKRLGTAVFHDLDGYLSWYSQLDYDDKTVENFISEHQKGLNREDKLREALNHCNQDWFSSFRYYSSIIGNMAASIFAETIQKNLPKLREFCEFSEKFNQSFSVAIWDESGAYLYLGNPKSGIFVPTPEKFLTFTAEKDFSNVSISDLRQLSGTTIEQTQNIVPAKLEGTLTQADIQSDLALCEEEMKTLGEEIENTRNCANGELAELKAQIKKMEDELFEKKSAMMAELQEKLEQMEEMKEKMETQIYMLDSQIYAIRCYTGEIINFAKIRSGKDAPIDVPLVIYQKLRFLDEDLARICSLYEIQWNQLNMFEDFLRNHPLALETFAPNDRCVMLIRLSRINRTTGEHDDMDCANMLKKYQYFHGSTVGIIIRNGENVYLGWTDEDRVHISDDLIISNVVTEVSPADEPDPYITERAFKEKAKAERREKMRIIDGLISRSFIYNILQGVVDSGKILRMPDGVKLNKQSEYVIYSIADKWLTDNRFESFSKIMERCNERVLEGDGLLTMQHLIPKSERYYNGHRCYNTGKWENVRGRGDRNRTHDCSVSDCTIYSANVVEYDEPRIVVEYENEYKDVLGKVHKSKGFMSADDFQRCIERGDPAKEVRRFEEVDRHVYISLEKTNSKFFGFCDTIARANFEIYNNEFLNLTYMNSVWLEWFITNQKLGDWTIGGTKVDYNYGIRYLKTALDYVRKRETEELSYLELYAPDISKDPDWPLKLSEWKLAHQVRKINSYQAKRFVKSLGK